MTYSVLASDYDGTLALHGAVDEATVRSLYRWREAGRKLVLITGREFEDTLQICSFIDAFDWVVTENGAMLYHPATQTEKPLTQGPPQEFVEALRDRVYTAARTNTAPLSEEMQRLKKAYPLVGQGRIIVSTWEPHSVEARSLIEEMGLDLQIILNKGAVMMLPTGIDKASGLAAAAQELEVELTEIVGVGDAENDLPFLNVCGYAVAVANALPEVQSQVDWVTHAERGAGVVELIDRLLNT
ncbi:HAD family hydrolase [Leptolyngbya sp. FACHB-8]|uniref:HAD family hydrolase n=1 Tax=unclassified Leptolyngbya TaxID=2650499 RepID=UPI001689C073|nr:HAD family hydrolase [Leptolyngbya sp. FACHB-8]MBD1913660.1 HAD family phosphatase [Leptolyngbya sp. FACHB-8]